MMETPGPVRDSGRATIAAQPCYADLADLFEQLACFVQGGVSIQEALDLMREGWEHRQTARFVAQLRARLGSGSSLSAALGGRSDVIPPFLCDIVAAGERSDALGDALSVVADYLHAVSTLMPGQTAKFKRVFYYPLAVLGVILLLTMLLLIFVVPQFTAMFSGMGMSLPALTRTIVTLSETAQVWLPVLLVIGGGLVLLWKWGFPQIPALQYAAIRLVLLIPGYRQLYRNGHSALLLLTWGFLLSRGMEFPAAVSASSELALGPYWRARLRSLGEALHSSGVATTGQLHGLVTPRVVQLMVMAGRLSNLDTLLLRQGRRYRQQVEESYRDLPQLFEPLLIVLIGIIVGVIVVAMYLPIFKLGSFV